MPTFSYQSGNAELDALRDLLDDNDHRRVVFSDELLQTFLKKAGEAHSAAALAFTWLAGNPEGLRQKFSLSQNASNSELLQAQDRALQLAERFEQQADLGLSTLDETFDPGAHLNELEYQRLR